MRELHSPVLHQAPTSQPPPSRVVIQGLRPEVAGGRFPAKRAEGEPLIVEADIYADGHDQIAAWVLYRRAGEAWSEIPMELAGNDHWQAGIPVEALGRYEYTVEAAIDRFGTWHRDLQKRLSAGQDVAIELEIGAQLLREAATRGSASKSLQAAAQALTDGANSSDALADTLTDPVVRAAREALTSETRARYGRVLMVDVDPRRAGFSTWYELFPRSTSRDPGRAGTFKDLAARLPYVADMGFDVLYLPPIHPVGVSHRKGKNGAASIDKADPGSPWAIGARAGGHTAVNPDLGTLDDFRNLQGEAKALGLDIALDIALQCSPDHPWVREHPEWFRVRPDGSVQCAENPPKKYEDIYPFDFESAKWRELWNALRDVFLFWAEQGVRIFRVDNPHTKPFPFWEWLIAEVKARYPETLFLAEAFTRPRVMERLAQLGFSQSYTYFTWRNSRRELTEYFEQLTRTEMRDYFRPNLWPNTPDILSEYLQTGGRPAFMIRLILAATLGANYGIYGPAFELGEAIPRELGSEEYLGSEKYEVRHWDLDSPASLRELITRVNQIRHTNAALQNDWSLRFGATDNEQLICYSKHSADQSNVVVAVVNVDPFNRQSGWVQIPLHELGIDDTEPFQVHDLLTDARYIWRGEWNYVDLDPITTPGHVLHVRRRLRSERNFDYYV
jgi:starch synthase (maltosyl-transferring)